jgi:ribosomal protein S18 acetylase RimI-like enzyme
MEGNLEIVERVPTEERHGLEPILEESFSGLYLWHSKKTLRQIEVVNSAVLNGKRVGLVMLKNLSRQIGYVYYIAVAAQYRGKGLGGALLDHTLSYLSRTGAEEVYASVELDNTSSVELFRSRGFRETSFGEVSKKYGRVEAAKLYSKMLVVPGETLLHRELSSSKQMKLDSDNVIEQ